MIKEIFWMHFPSSAHRGFTLWLPVDSRDDRCELLWRHPRPDRSHPQNQHQQCPTCRHSNVHYRSDKFHWWINRISARFIKVNTLNATEDHIGDIHIAPHSVSELFSHQVLWLNGWQITLWCLAVSCPWCFKLWAIQTFLFLLSLHWRKFVGSASMTCRPTQPTS